MIGRVQSQPRREKGTKHENEVRQHLHPPTQRGADDPRGGEVDQLCQCPVTQTNQRTASTAPATPLAAPGIAELQSASDLQRVVDEAYAKFKDDHTGKNADYIPYLASVSSNLFGVAIVTVDGQVFTASSI